MTSTLPLDRLCDQDNKYWAPLKLVADYIESLIPSDAVVLEVGPGQYFNFKRADAAVDLMPSGLVAPEKMHVCDINYQKLPFPDKTFDFVYCRHTLEDIYDPFFACREMSRVGRAGYIETPSPVAELCRGIDGGSPGWRGYNHHRWFVWAYGNELRFLSKFAFLEMIQFSDEQITAIVRTTARYWNTHYLWKDEIEVRDMQWPVGDVVIPDGYAAVLTNAMQATYTSNNIFFDEILGQKERVA